MKAKNITGQAPGGTRKKLADILPLRTPLVVQVFPIYACNFKCCYCLFSVEKTKRHFISDKPIMDMGLYRKFVDESLNFPEKIKVLRFVGIGEPLLHKNIVEMVEYAVQKGVANTVEILTNASLLHRDMTDSLLKAGLNRLVVSVQGTSEQKYKNVCGADVNFEEFIRNLKYFYENKNTSVQMYIKIVDTALDGPDDEQKFFEIFGDICDTIAIECTVPIHSGVDYEKVIKNEEQHLTQFGVPVTDVCVCPQAFFHFQINPDGKVVPCFSFEYPEILGDCNTESVSEIWNGEKFKKFRRKMLEGKEAVGNICSECNIIKYRMFPEDDLKDHVERIKKYYE